LPTAGEGEKAEGAVYPPLSFITVEMEEVRVTGIGREGGGRSELDITLDTVGDSDITFSSC
jgi:hypothetical protein